MLDVISAQRPEAPPPQPPRNPSDAESPPAPAPLQPNTQAGVGPWVGPWPDDPRLDPELLANGDSRNVVDQFRYWRLEAIVAELGQRRHGFFVAIENWEHDFNIGAIVRTANAFAAAGVHIVGRRRWNRRGAMVTDRYLPVWYHPEVADLQVWASQEGLPIIGLDNLPGAEPLEQAALPRRCVLLFGSEGPGLSQAALAACDQLLEITQYGSTRSLNAGAAAAIAMYHWILLHAAGTVAKGTGEPRSRLSR